MTRPSDRLASTYMGSGRHPEWADQRVSRGPTRPAGMSREAVMVWDDTVPKLERLGLAMDVDGRALADYCEDVVLVNKIRDESRSQSTLVQGTHGQVMNPTLRALDVVLRRKHQMEKALGLCAGGRVGMPKTRDKGDDKPGRDRFTPKLASG